MGPRSGACCWTLATPVVSGSATLFNRFRRLVNEKRPIGVRRAIRCGAASRGASARADSRIFKHGGFRSPPTRGGDAPFRRSAWVRKAARRPTPGSFLEGVWPPPGAVALGRYATNMSEPGDRGLEPTFGTASGFLASGRLVSADRGRGDRSKVLSAGRVFRGDPFEPGYPSLRGPGNNGPCPADAAASACASDNESTTPREAARARGTHGRLNAGRR